LLQAALDIEDDMENLRYNNIVIATDADVDGMQHSIDYYFFLQFFPELIKDGHLYILQTPLSGTKQERNYLLLF
jgi:topoisomerase-4 subunit B